MRTSALMSVEDQNRSRLERECEEREEGWEAEEAVGDVGRSLS